MTHIMDLENLVHVLDPSNPSPPLSGFITSFVSTERTRGSIYIDMLMSCDLKIKVGQHSFPLLPIMASTRSCGFRIVSIIQTNLPP